GVGGCGRGGERGGLAEVGGCGGGGEEVALVALVGHQIQCGDGSIDRRRHCRHRRTRGVQISFTPQPADFAPQPQRDLRQPVLRERVVPTNTGHEGDGISRRRRGDRVGGHGVVTPGLAWACWLFTRRIARYVPAGTAPPAPGTVSVCWSAEAVTVSNRCTVAPSDGR